MEKRDIPATDKASAWDRLLKGYGDDNPYSNEDEAILNKARKQLEYWRNYRAPAQQKPDVQDLMQANSAYSVSGVPGLKMVPIPGGSFMMGSNDGDDDEKPVHQVTLSSFSMSATEITQAQYEAVMGTNPSSFKGDKLPVEQVSWDDAMEFCRKLSSKTGRKYRLPTEAEWEYACRAGTTTKYYSGSSENGLSGSGWYRENSGTKTHPVGQKAPNSWGLYDMHGNVWEWCSDWYGKYSNENATNPQGALSGSYRVDRGGGWSDNAGLCRAAYRGNGDPNRRLDFIGFRVVGVVFPLQDFSSF